MALFYWNIFVSYSPLLNQKLWLQLSKVSEPFATIQSQNGTIQSRRNEGARVHMQPIIWQMIIFNSSNSTFMILNGNEQSHHLTSIIMTHTKTVKWNNVPTSTPFDLVTHDHATKLTPILIFVIYIKFVTRPTTKLKPFSPLARWTSKGFWEAVYPHNFQSNYLHIIYKLTKKLFWKLWRFCLEQMFFLFI